AGSGVWERGPMLCAAGVGAAMAGLPGLAFALANAAPGGWLAVTTALLLAAPVLVWRGANALAEASRGAQPTGSVDGSAEAMSRPVIVCSALALAVALYALATGGVVDRAAMVFGTLAV